MILGIGNKAQNGKDTAGEAIVGYFNTRRQIQVSHGVKPSYPEARIFKFADALYKVCREEHGMIDKDAPLLQKVGNSRRVEFGLDYWINKLADSMKGFDGLAVITDMRYANEADWVKSVGGTTVQVTRLNQDGSQFIATDRDPNHPSEIELDGYNFDAYIKSKSAALTGEYAITLAEFMKGLKS